MNFQRNNRKSFIVGFALILTIALISSLTCIFSLMSREESNSAVSDSYTENGNPSKIGSSIRLMDEKEGNDSDNKFDKDKYNNDDDKVSSKPEKTESTSEDIEEPMDDSSVDTEEPKVDDSDDAEEPKVDDSDDAEEPKVDDSDDTEEPKDDDSDDAEEPKDDDSDDAEESKDDDPDDAEESKDDDPDDAEESKDDDSDDTEDPKDETADSDKTDSEENDKTPEDNTHVTPDATKPNVPSEDAKSFSVTISTDMSSAFGKIKRTITFKVPLELGEKSLKEIKDILNDKLPENITFSEKDKDSFKIYEFSFECYSIKKTAELTEIVLKEKSIITKNNSVIPFTSGTYTEAITVTELASAIGLSIDSISANYCIGSGQILEAENASEDFIEHSNSVNFDSQNDHKSLSFRYRKINAIRIIVYILILAAVAAVTLLIIFFMKKKKDPEDQAINGIRFSEIGSVRVSAKDIKLPENK